MITSLSYCNGREAAQYEEWIVLHPFVWMSSREMLSILAMVWSWYSEVMDSMLPTRMRQELKNPTATHITVHWDRFPIVLSESGRPALPSLFAACWSCLWMGMFCMRLEILASLPSLTEAGRKVGRSTREREEPRTKVTFLLPAWLVSDLLVRSILTVWCLLQVWLQADWVALRWTSPNIFSSAWQLFSFLSVVGHKVTLRGFGLTSVWSSKAGLVPAWSSSSSSHLRMSCKLSDGITTAVILWLSAHHWRTVWSV